MNSTVRLPMWALGIVFSAPMISANETGRATIWNNPDRPSTHGLVHGSFHSEALGREVGFNVSLPPDYERGTKRYPVIYFLHGSGGDENSDAAAFSGLVGAAVAGHNIPDVICVFPNGGRRSGYRDNATDGTNVESMIARELVPLVDRSYRTRASREARVIVGFSMGGAGAVRFALKYPELFSAAGSWAGAFSGLQTRGMLAADFSADVLTRVAGRVRLMLVVGARDLTLPDHAPMLGAAIAAKSPIEFELLADVEHDPGAYYQHSGEKMLRFLTLGWK